jgi:hypothetical protein
MAAGATYEPIATTTLGTAGTITFSSIPATYTDLRLVITGITSSATILTLRINGDTATNYSHTYIQGNGTAVTSSRATSDTSIDFHNVQVTSTTLPFFASADFFSYAGSTNKTVLMNMNLDKNGSGEVDTRVGLWRSTSAITSLLIEPNAGNLAIGTTATLYGIKAA